MVAASRRACEPRHSLSSAHLTGRLFCVSHQLEAPIPRRPGASPRRPTHATLGLAPVAGRRFIADRGARGKRSWLRWPSCMSLNIGSAATVPFHADCPLSAEDLLKGG